VNPTDLPADTAAANEMLEAEGQALLAPLLQGDMPTSHEGPSPGAFAGVVIGELLALTDDGTTLLVRLPGQQGGAVVPARSTVDLHGAHIGSAVVLVFELADQARPIVMGVLRGRTGWPLAEAPAQVEVDADGQRMIVSAREQLVLRCGKASITLTRAGKVLVEGSYVLTRSTGVNRIKGGSVQLN
jgi:hypothetical protein